MEKVLLDDIPAWPADDIANHEHFHGQILSSSGRSWTSAEQLA
jgi:hypothetical protein